MTEQDIEQLIETCGTPDAEVRSHIEAVRVEYGKNLDRWCVRRRRLDTVGRFVLVACLAVAVMAVSAEAWTHDDVALNVTTTADATGSYICGEIYNMLIG